MKSKINKEKIPYRKKSSKRRMKQLSEHRKILLLGQTFPTSNVLLVSALVGHYSFKMDFLKKFSKIIILDSYFDLKRIPKPLCSHLLVGCSLVSHLLTKRLTLARRHVVYYTGDKRRSGKYAEHFYSTKISHATPDFCVRSRKLPFIISSVDMLRKYKSNDHQTKLEVIEIKSSGKHFILNNLKSDKIKKVITQIQVSLDVFNLEVASLAIIKVSDNKAEPYSTYCVKVYQNEHFLTENRHDLIKGYIKCVFSKYVRKFFGIVLSSFETKEVIQFYIDETEDLKESTAKSTLINLGKRKLKFDRTMRDCVELYKPLFINN